METAMVSSMSTAITMHALQPVVQVSGYPQVAFANMTDIPGQPLATLAQGGWALSPIFPKFGGPLAFESPGVRARDFVDRLWRELAMEHPYVPFMKPTGGDENVVTVSAMQFLGVPSFPSGRTSDEGLAVMGGEGGSAVTGEGGWEVELWCRGLSALKGGRLAEAMVAFSRAVAKYDAAISSALEGIDLSRNEGRHRDVVDEIDTALEFLSDRQLVLEMQSHISERLRLSDRAAAARGGMDKAESKMIELKRLAIESQVMAQDFEYRKNADGKRVQGIPERIHGMFRSDQPQEQLRLIDDVIGWLEAISVPGAEDKVSYYLTLARIYDLRGKFVRGIVYSRLAAAGGLTSTIDDVGFETELNELVTRQERILAEGRGDFLAAAEAFGKAASLYHLAADDYAVSSDRPWDRDIRAQNEGTSLWSRGMALEDAGEEGEAYRSYAAAAELVGDSYGGSLRLIRTFRDGEAIGYGDRMPMNVQGYYGRRLSSPPFSDGEALTASPFEQIKYGGIEKAFSDRLRWRVLDFEFYMARVALDAAGID